MIHSAFEADGMLIALSLVCLVQTQLRGAIMKIAITSQGPLMDSPVDPRFGRTRHFIVVDTETGEFSAVDNSVNLNAAQGAGIQAGRKVVELGVEAVVTGHVGPKAMSALQAGGIKVYTGAADTVADAVEKFKTGGLQLIESADVEGHWS
jgi:predicted Fe-Mo cluster-binding NifX family protein